MAVVDHPAWLRGDGDGAEQSATGYLVDQMALQMEELQTLYAKTEEGRSETDARIAELAGAVVRLTERIEAEKGQSALLRRIAVGQEKLIEVLQGEEGGGKSDPESRMRLRSIDVQLLRILEEMSAGRQETLSDLKTDIAALTSAIRLLGRSTGRA